MRWDNLSVERQAESALPGFKEPAVVRTFDAPEAMGIRFYEVRARSAINKVPKRSRMPFRHTINPYRGCSHGCTYCLSGHTPILMLDGRTKRLDAVEVGDWIYGTEFDGKYHRYVATAVLAHWQSDAEAYRISLEDGTELIASGDHRFLTAQRGWKHVTGKEWGRHRRPHLTLNSKLMGTGRFVEVPADSIDYRRGYLCGMVRGDGHVGHYAYDRPGRTHGDVHRFRLALEGLRRTREYLEEFQVQTDEFLFARASASTRSMTAIRTSARRNVEQVEALIQWPTQTSDDWCKGFLAGIFDAEGHHRECIRIANTDDEIIEWTCYCLRQLGFSHVVEWTKNRNRPRNVRISGGLKAKLRFFHLTDPAISRKRSIEGAALKSNAPLSVVSIEPIGPRKLYDITTGTGDFIANGVVSHNCFARPTHTYLDFNAREDFEREIVVKVNAPELVRAELARPSWQGDHVAMGTNTDPYQWVEGRYRLTRGIWEAMLEAENPCSVLTKSPLLLRDIDLFVKLVERTEFVANLSIPTLDEKAWRASEPHTPHPRTRIEAVAELSRVGVPAGVLIAPLMPGINDDPAQVSEILELVGEAGARSIGGVGLHLRGEVRGIVFDWLRQYRPDLVPRYERLYERGAYLPSDERKRLSALVGARGRLRPGSASPAANNAPVRSRPPAQADRQGIGPHQPQQGALF